MQTTSYLLAQQRLYIKYAWAQTHLHNLYIKYHSAKHLTLIMISSYKLQLYNNIYIYIYIYIYIFFFKEKCSLESCMWVWPARARDLECYTFTIPVSLSLQCFSLAVQTMVSKVHCIPSNSATHPHTQGFSAQLNMDKFIESDLYSVKLGQKPSRPRQSWTFLVTNY